MLQFLKFCARAVKNAIATQSLALMSKSDIEPNTNISLDLKFYDLGENVYIGENCYLDPGISVGRFSRLGDRVTIHCSPSSKVKIGKFCSISSDVSLITTYHPIEYLSTSYRVLKFKGPNSIAAPINIGNDVWVGKNAIILQGVTIGDGAIIGAGSVVTKDVDEYSIVVGNPAKKIRERFSQEKIQEIKKLNWWDWPLNKIYDNQDLFYKKIS